jgi:N-methylhydantoinase A/oxoprolinase/acetone carboxylase beta subunit
MKIGVDVGGTNTDAVLLSGASVRASVKMPTTADIASGVFNAVSDVLRQAGCGPEQVEAVMIGTTQFTNAFVERKRLVPVGILRLSLPTGAGVPPLVDWPADLVDVVGRNVYLAHGGFEFDGRPISALDEMEVASAARDMRARSIDAVAISSVFSPLDSSMERRAADIVLNEHPDARVTLSSEIGRLGLIERENACIMNASLAKLAGEVVSAFRCALRTLRIPAPFYVSQNDGTLMSADYVERYPVLTFASGPTNSMRGAAYLTDKDDAIVIDIGGTTTDVGVLAQGFPRESSISADIGGVRTNFRMPDVLSIGLGGGSIVRTKDRVTLGPDSVGFRLTEMARVFGGATLTATDIAVAAGKADIGDRSRVADVDRRLIAAAEDAIHAMVEEAIDRMKTRKDAVPVVLVGGGSVLISRELKGTTEVTVPKHSGVANAIGAAMAQVGGEVDRVFSYEQLGRDGAIEAATREAKSRCLEAGAVEKSLQLLDIEELPLTYMPGGSVRLRVKVVGDLAKTEAR